MSEMQSLNVVKAESDDGMFLDTSWASKLLQGLDVLREQHAFCDTQILTDDGQSFAAHSDILSACSATLAACFPDDSGDRQYEIPICNVQGSTVEALLLYIYSGKVTVSCEVQELEFLASCLEIHGLIDFMKKVHVTCDSAQLQSLSDDTEQKGDDGIERHAKMKQRKTPGRRVKAQRMPTPASLAEQPCKVEPQLSETRRRRTGRVANVTDDIITDSSDECSMEGGETEASKQKIKDPSPSTDILTQTAVDMNRKRARNATNDDQQYFKRQCTTKLRKAVTPSPRITRSGRKVVTSNECKDIAPQKSQLVGAGDTLITTSDSPQKGHNRDVAKRLSPQEDQNSNTRDKHVARSPSQKEQVHDAGDMHMALDDIDTQHGLENNSDEASMNTNISTSSTSKNIVITIKKEDSGVETFPVTDSASEIKHAAHKKSNFSCGLCDKTFTAPHIMRKHRRTEHNFLPCFLCVFCLEGFSLKRDNDSHLMAEHPSLARRCTFCSRVGPNDEMKEHEERDHAAPVKSDSLLEFKCSYCGKSFSKESHCRDHEMGIHEGIKPHQCSTCGKGFATKGAVKIHEDRIHKLNLRCEHCQVEHDDKKSLVEHMRLNHPDDMIKCTECPKLYLNYVDLQRHQHDHIRSKHRSQPRDPEALARMKIGEGEKNVKYQCKFCKREYCSKQSVLEHERRIHEKILPFKCSQCEKSFVSKQILTTHIETHEVITNCEICDSEVSGKNDLLTHMQEKHPDDLLYCSQCTKPFLTSADLQRHLNDHKKKDRNAVKEEAGISTLHHCTHCSRAFSSKQSLKLHVMRTHEGILPFKCSKCPKRFVSRRIMEVHASSCASSFPCCVCDAVFKFKRELMEHTKGVHPDKLFNCQVCKRPYLTEKDLKAHEYEHKDKSKPSQSKTFTKCPYCPKVNVTRHHVYQHEINQNGFKCELCNRKLRSQEGLRKHQELNHKDMIDCTCQLCSTKFNSKSELLDHMEGLHPEKLFKCSVCEKLLLTHQDLCKHRILHREDRGYSCQYCQKTFKTMQTLESHERQHRGERSFKCTLCDDKAFFTSNGLAAHMDRHMGKVFTCHICSKQLISRYNLQCHMRTVHTNERPHPCKHCDQAFVSNSMLRRHMRTMHAGTVFQCEKCTKVFSNTAALRLHMKIHSDIRPFKCSECDKSFRRPGHLKEHLRRHGLEPVQFRKTTVIAADIEASQALAAVVGAASTVHGPAESCEPHSFLPEHVQVVSSEQVVVADDQIVLSTEDDQQVILTAEQVHNTVTISEQQPQYTYIEEEPETAIVYEDQDNLETILSQPAVEPGSLHDTVGDELGEDNIVVLDAEQLQQYAAEMAAQGKTLQIIQEINVDSQEQMNV